MAARTAPARSRARLRRVQGPPAAAIAAACGFRVADRGLPSRLPENGRSPARGAPGFSGWYPGPRRVAGPTCARARRARSPRPRPRCGGPCRAPSPCPLLDPLAERDLARPRAPSLRTSASSAVSVISTVRSLKAASASSGLQPAVAPLALGLDVLLAQVHRLLDRPLDDAAGHPHPAGRDLALADRELLLDHRHALLAAGRPRSLLLAGGLVAVHDRDRAVDLLLRHLRGDQRLAAAGGRPRTRARRPRRSRGRDLAPSLVLAALHDRDVRARRPASTQLLTTLPAVSRSKR